MADYFAARGALAVNAHATDPLTKGTCKAIYVGGAGNITCRLRGDSADVVFTAVPVGATIYAEVSHVRATGTTATNMLALYD
jgi:hypothetical protein